MSGRLKYIVQELFVSGIQRLLHLRACNVPPPFSHLPYLMDLKLSHIVYNFPHYRSL